MATGYGLDDLVRFPAGVSDFCLLHSIQTGSRAHTTSSPTDTVNSFLEVKEELSCPFTSK
jgi:hypothetical protein